MRTLYQGSRGDEVKLLQHKLGLHVDGTFGPVTFRSLKYYQGINSLTQDGICGAGTWAKILSDNLLNCKESSSSFNVVKVKLNTIDMKLHYNPAPVSIRSLAQLLKPDFIMNAGMYNNAPGKPGYGLTIVDTMVNGKLVGGGNFAPIGLAFTPGEAAICGTQEAKINYMSFIGFSPDMLPGMNTKGLSSAFIHTANAYRTGVGIDNKGYIYFITTNKTMPLMAFRQKFVDLGCVEAGNFDGGGSTQAAFYTEGMYIKQTTQSDIRKNATYISFKFKEGLR